MSDCAQCDPCETQTPQVCEELPISDAPKRIIVENENFCKETIASPNSISVFYFDGENPKWVDGSESQPISLPSLRQRSFDFAPRIGSLNALGQLNYWRPVIAGNNFILYWDGSQFTIDILTSFLPSGDGVYVKAPSSSSFENGINGQYLYIENGQIQFKTIAPATPESGSIFCFAGNSAPSGWLLCDGSAYGRTALDPSPQPTLFSIIGTTYGSGDGLTTFNIPDLRGMFLRGLDNARGIDPSRSIGSQQNSGLQAHNHSGFVASESNHTHGLTGTTTNESNTHRHFVANNDAISPPTNPIDNSNYWAARYTGSGFNSMVARGTATQPTIGLTNNQSSSHIHNLSGSFGAGTPHNHSISSYGVTETRPINMALNWIIKT